MKKRQYDHEQGAEKANFTMAELTEEQLEQVNGGLNPQPLPPGAPEAFRLENKGFRQGIIVIGGYQE